MGNAFSNAGNLIISFVFGFAIAVLLLRVLLQLLRVPFQNPVSHTIAQLTNPITIPVARIIPRSGRWDWPAIVVAWFFQVLETLFLYLINGAPLFFPGILVFAIPQLLDFVVLIFIAAIFVMVILSWVQPDPRNPIVAMLRQFTAPYSDAIPQLNPPDRYIGPVCHGGHFVPVPDPCAHYTAINADDSALDPVIRVVRKARRTITALFPGPKQGGTHA